MAQNPICCWRRTGETPCTAEGERSHPGLLQQVQLESLYWPAKIWLAPAWGGNNHWLDHLIDPFCAVNEYAGQGSWNRVQRPPQQVWSKATSHKSLNGWPHSENNGGTGSQVDPSGVGETHIMGMHELQTCKVQVFSSKEGEGYRQIPL